MLSVRYSAHGEQGLLATVTARSAPALLMRDACPPGDGGQGAHCALRRYRHMYVDQTDGDGGRGDCCHCG